MKIFFRILVLVLMASVGLSRYSLAQKQYNIWYFGYQAGIDFNNDTVVSIAGGKTNTFEGCASICDGKTGAILFYTDGDTVWNRNNQPMPNGTGLFGNYSSTQTAMIIGDPDSPDRYYLFTSDQGGYLRPSRGINYSIVDMTLDGGLGDITTKNIHLLDSATEKLTAVRQPNSCNSWVIAHQFHSDAFYVWKVNDTGFVSAPVISKVGIVQTGVPDETIGYLVSSQDGTRLAEAIYVTGQIELFDFDFNTGAVSQPILLNGFPNVYGICFSPDGSKLYTSEYQSENILQFDLTSNDPNTILSSEFQVSFGDAPMAIMPGPDDRLYVACSGRNYVSVIDSPNSQSAACNYISHGIPLKSGQCESGLPNICYSYINEPSHSCLLPVAHIASVPTICAGDCITVSDTINNAVSFAWELDGSQNPVVTTEDPGIICYDSAGIYKIKLTVTDAGGDQTADSTFVTVTNSIALTLEAIGGRTDTIGGDVRVPFKIIQNGVFSTGSLSFNLTYDTTNLQFGGFFSDSGNREDDLLLDSNGKAFVTLDSAEIDNRLQLGYALFQLFPVNDSCFTVSFNHITLSPAPAGCVVLNSPEGKSVSATICAPNRCGTAILSNVIRTGVMPSWNIVEIDSHHLQLNYKNLASDAALTIYDELGRALVRQQVPSSNNGNIEISLSNSANGKFFAVLSIAGGALETRKVFVEQ